MKLFILVILALCLTTFAAEKSDTVTIIDCRCDTTVIVRVTKDTSVFVRQDTLKAELPKKQPKKVKPKKKGKK